MRVKKYLALTFAAVLATTMLTACPWDQEEDKTDDASSVPVTSTDTSQDDDSSDSGDDDSQPTKPSLTVGGEMITVGGGESKPISVTENGTTTGTYTVKLEQSSDTLTMTIETQPEENYVTNSVTATVDNQSTTWNRNENTATRARTLSVRADTQLSLTTNDNGETFTLTGIPADATSCNITVEFKDPGYTIENDTYMVYNADGLLAWNAAVQGNMSLNCTLTDDIDLEGTNWTPIGNSYSNAYAGTFDGGGHTISGLQVSGGDYIGLFGYVNGGTVKNLNLEIASISGNDYVGGVVGYNYNGIIQGCMVSGGSVTASNDRAYVGGVVGYNSGTSKVEGCCFAGDSVSGTGDSAYVGGVVGRNYGTIQGCCFAGGSVSGSGSVGGVVGSNYSTIMDCYWKKDTNGPDKGVGDGNGDTTPVTNGDWNNAIKVMNGCIEGTGYQYELENGKPVLVASGSNTTELPGLTQKVLDAVRVIGL